MKTKRFKVTIRRWTHVIYERPEFQGEEVYHVESSSHKLAALSVGMPRSLRINGPHFWSNQVPFKTREVGQRRNFSEWIVDECPFVIEQDSLSGVSFFMHDKHRVVRENLKVPALILEND